MCTNEVCCYHEKRGKCIHDNKYKLPVVEISTTGTGNILFKCPICDEEHICGDSRKVRP